MPSLPDVFLYKLNVPLRAGTAYLWFPSEMDADEYDMIREMMTAILEARRETVIKRAAARSETEKQPPAAPEASPEGRAL